MNRRGFFGRVAGLIGIPFVPKPPVRETVDAPVPIEWAVTYTLREGNVIRRGVAVSDILDRGSES